jgi:hypothetical protein
VVLGPALVLVELLGPALVLVPAVLLRPGVLLGTVLDPEVLLMSVKGIIVTVVIIAVQIPCFVKLKSTFIATPLRYFSDILPSFFSWRL